MFKIEKVITFKKNNSNVILPLMKMRNSIKCYKGEHFIILELHHIIEYKKTQIEKEHNYSDIFSDKQLYDKMMEQRDYIRQNNLYEKDTWKCYNGVSGPYFDSHKQFNCELGQYTEQQFLIDCINNSTDPVEIVTVLEHSIDKNNPNINYTEKETEFIDWCKIIEKLKDDIVMRHTDHEYRRDAR